MGVTREDIEYTARLAKLKVTGESAEGLIDSMSEILGYFEKLQELSTENVTPTTHPETNWASVRPDEPSVPLQLESVMKNAPESSEEHFVVPRVL